MSYAPIVYRVAARFQREADLSPPLGNPGGPCQVLNRIEDKVRDPSMRYDMTQEVSHGDSLTNAEASKIYPLDQEPGAGYIKKLLITSHGQYRMDLRSVTVDDVRKALAAHAKMINDFKAQKHPGYERMVREVQMGKVEFIDPKTNLEIVFTLSGDKTATLVTCFWKGKGDPKPVDPAACQP